MTQKPQTRRRRACSLPVEIDLPFRIFQRWAREVTEEAAQVTNVAVARSACR